MGAAVDKAECLPLPLLDEAYNVVQLLDGRSLAFREYGDPEGVPVVFYHGSMSSRLFMPSWDETHEAAVSASARVIAVDRPGYGHSSAHSGRAYMDNGAELRALLASVDGLAGSRRVALLGHESGGPNALAAAYVTRVPGVACQVAAVGLVSPQGPQLELGQAQGTAQATEQDAKAAAAASFARLQMACEDLYESWPDHSRLLAADLTEATRQGLAAAEQDFLLERSPWDFQLEDVDCRVLLWQGLEDDSMEGSRGPPGTDVSAVAMARHMAARLPDCSANFVKGENHLLVRRRWEDVLAALVDEVRHVEHRRMEHGDPLELSPATWRDSVDVVVEPVAAQPVVQEPPVAKPLRLEVPKRPMTPGQAPPLLHAEPTGPPTPLAALAE